MLPPDFYSQTLRAAYPPEHTYKVALYKELVKINTYTPKGEENGRGYTAQTLTGYRVENGTLYFNRMVEWFDVDIAARCAVIYDATNGNVLAIQDFGQRCGVINGVFTLTLSEEGVVAIGRMD